MYQIIKIGGSHHAGKKSIAFILKRLQSLNTAQRGIQPLKESKSFSQLLKLLILKGIQEYPFGLSFSHYSLYRP
jgi:hypothetical protein